MSVANPLYAVSQGVPLVCRPGINPETGSASFSHQQSDGRLEVLLTCPTIGLGIQVATSDPWIVILNAKRSKTNLPYSETWLIEYRLRQNDSGSDRKGWIQYRQGTYYGILNLTQKAKPVPVTPSGAVIPCPVTALNPKSSVTTVNKTGNSGSHTITVSCGGASTLTATSQASWLTVDSVKKDSLATSRSSQTWVIKYRVSTNTTGKQRTGQIIFTHPRTSSTAYLEVRQSQ